jgi:hypothetical protein
MVNFLAIGRKIDEQKIEFIEWFRNYVNDVLRPQLIKEISKKLNDDKLLQLEEMEKKQLSEANAQFFLKCIKAIKAIEKTRNPGPKVAKIAEEVGLLESEVEILLNAVRYHRLYEKFMASKDQIIRFI